MERTPRDEPEVEFDNNVTYMDEYLSLKESNSKLTQNGRYWICRAAEWAIRIEECQKGLDVAERERANALRMAGMFANNPEGAS